MEEAYPEAAAILRDAGWKPHPEWGVHTRGTLIMGGFAGSFHVKDFARIPPDHPLYSDDTPDTAEEAAQWLVKRFGNPLTTEATLEPVALQSEEAETPQHDAPHVEIERADAAEEPEEWRHDQRHASEGASERDDVVDDLASGGSGDGDYSSDPIDADFEAIDQLGLEDGSEDALTDDDFALLDRIAREGVEPAQDGPIAYGASTIDGLIREKLGRVSQIARELKRFSKKAGPWKSSRIFKT